VTDLCTLFGVSKQAYYQYDENAALAKYAREAFALQFIHQIRELDPGIGGMKLWYMYHKKFGCDSPIGRDRFCDIIDRHNLKIRLKIRKPKTTDSTHGLPTYPNLVKDFIPTAANQLWVSDITYIVILDSNTHYHFCYLSLILDAFTEEIVGWNVGPTLDTQYPMEALRMALQRLERKEDIHLIHHSDRGCQYASNEYIKELKSHNIQISMTECGDPKDNAQAERINNTMKNELLKDKVFRNIDQVVAAVSIAVDFYNNQRPHMSIGMLAPAEAVNLRGDRDMKWKSSRLEAIMKNQNLEIPENCLLLPSSQPLTGIRLG
jgi:putative transposase